jgi:hypothetical protein
MAMAHEGLHGLQVVPVVQENRGKGVPHDVRMNPLLDQGLFYHGSDETVNSFLCEPAFPVRPVLREGLEEGVVRICPVPGGLVVIPDVGEGPGVQGDAPELLPFTVARRRRPGCGGLLR